MRTTLIFGALLLFVTGPIFADTQVGQVNTSTTKHYSFRMVGGGQVGVTLSWLNGGADLVMTVVCGDTEPVVFGSAMGDGLKRFAQINAGVPSDVACLVGVTASRNGSKFWINVMQQADTSIAGRGRQPKTAVGQTEPRSNLAPAVIEQLKNLVDMTRVAVETR